MAVGAYRVDTLDIHREFIICRVFIADHVTEVRIIVTACRKLSVRTVLKSIGHSSRSARCLPAMLSSPSSRLVSSPRSDHPPWQSLPRESANSAELGCLCNHTMKRRRRCADPICYSQLQQTDGRPQLTYDWKLFFYSASNFSRCQRMFVRAGCQ